MRGVRWNLKVVLICSSLMVKQFLKCLSALCNSSLESSLALYPIFIPLMSSFLSSLCILEISPLSDVGLVKIFSQSVGSCFVLLIVSFGIQKFSVSADPIY